MKDEHADVLAIGAHPDDVELGCGGTLALLAAQGRRVSILHLTRGEAGTRGTAELRRREAERAAEILGAARVDFLDCGDAELRTGRAEEDAVVEQIRRHRPELVLAPPPLDRHPDHGRAHRLVTDACFYAGLVKRAPGIDAPPHRPGLLLCYMQHRTFEPSIVVDVSQSWKAKLAALAAHESQFHRADGSSGEEGGEPQTLVSSSEFVAAVDGRGRHFGMLIGVRYGEPFWSPTPLSVRDPWHLLPRGHR